MFFATLLQPRIILILHINEDIFDPAIENAAQIVDFQGADSFIMTQLIDGGAGDVMIFDERIGGFSRAAQVETERLSACLKTAFDNDPELC